MNQNQRESGWILKAGMWVCGILAAVCLVSGLVEWKAGSHAVKDFNDLKNLGDFGSFLQGTVASLWALAGVFLIVLAFFGQQQQLLLQRKQLAGQEEQFNTQLGSIKRQNFETAFFQLLSLQNELVRGMLYFAPDNRQIQGRACFTFWHRSFMQGLEDWLRQVKGHFDPQPQLKQYMTMETIIAYYETVFYPHYEDDLGHYFRNLYHIIKFVRNSDVEDKRRYTSLVRAQLSKFELFFIFYNALSSYGKGFKPMIEEFGLLEHLDKRLLLQEEHARGYAPSAYQ